MFVLKVKNRNHPDKRLDKKVGPNSTLLQLKEVICEILCIQPRNQKILVGYPPVTIGINDADKLSKSKLTNGDVIIVEECSTPALKTESSPSTHLVAEVVPSDNSCLFSSIHYLINYGNKDFRTASEKLRENVATKIRNNKELYTEVMLERSNEEYCEWIKKDTTWGGAIEISILCEHFKIEIVVIDAARGILTRFGEAENFQERIFLLFDGIHYDPVKIISSDFGTLYSVPCSVDGFLEEAKKMAKEQHSKGIFTDTANFAIKCGQCGLRLKGEKEAVEHAKATNHSDFREISQKS